MNVPDKLRNEIEAAYDYRGHVMVRLKNGSSVEGFVFNRQYDAPNSAEQYYIDLFLKNSDEKRRLPISELASIDLSGKDFAETYDQFLKRTGGKT